MGAFDVRFFSLALQDFIPNKKRLAEMYLRGAKTNIRGLPEWQALRVQKSPRGIAPKANF